jgi:uncharacterized protein YecT (DUF1311 family)
MKKFVAPLLLLAALTFCSFMAFSQTQAEMNQSAFEEYQKSDVELNKVYSQLLQKLDNDEKLLLIKAQKDWIKFRDSHCTFEVYVYEGGSMQPMMYASCLRERTDARVKDLKDLMEIRSGR